MADLTVPQPKFQLIYEAKDITVDLERYILQITCTDVLGEESDELQVNIEDRRHRWKNGWFPEKGAQLALAIGYEGSPLVRMGTYEIDEIEFNGPPDTVSIRALAAGVKGALRTDNTVAYEDRTLRQIAEEIAGRNGLTLTGEGEALDRHCERVTQHKESDIAFLNRLGKAEGIVFDIKGGKLVWHDQSKLDEAKPVIVLKRTDLGHHTFRAKTATTFKACQVSYHDPKTKTLRSHTEKAEGVPSGDTLKLVERCESLEQAEAKARAALRNSNGRQVEGFHNLYGNPRLRAGCNIEMQGFGLLDGEYQILRARHSMDRCGGYVTDIEISTTEAHNKNLKNLRNLKRVTHAGGRK